MRELTNKGASLAQEEKLLKQVPQGLSLAAEWASWGTLRKQEQVEIYDRGALMTNTNKERTNNNISAQPRNVSQN